MLFAVCFPLLTCTPPNFDDDPVDTGEPLTISPLRPQVAAGSKLTFSGAGGTTPYTYSIFTGSGDIDPTTGIFTAPPATGPVTIRVTDTATVRQHADTVVTVTAAPLTLTPTNIASLQTNEHALFHAGGGETPYVYSIVSGVGIIGSASGDYYSPSTGTGIVVKVTDKNGTGNERTATIGAVVDPPTPPVTISPSTLTVQRNAAYEFTIAGGKPPYSFQVTQGTASPASGSSNPFTETFTTVGVVKITASDSSSTPKTDVATITVNAPPLVIAPSTLTINANSTWTFSADGGTPGYDYSIIPSGNGIVDGNQVTFTTIGPCTVRVTDDASPPQTADCQVIVNTPPAALSINPPAITLTRGNTQLFTASGGSGSGYIFSKVSGAGTMLSGGLYTATSEGPAQIKLVDDADHDAYADIIVNAPPLGLDATSVTIEVGDSHQFVASGGTPPYTFTPISGVGSISSGGLFTSDDPGTAVIKVTDSSTYPVGGLSITASITVNPAPLTISPTGPSIMAGSTITFTATGGTEGTGYTFSKVSGVGSVNASTGEYTSSTVGSALIRVTDQTMPTHWTADATVTVTAPPLQITPTVVNLSYNSGQDFDATGGVIPYTFEIVSGGGSINGTTGVFTAPSAEGPTVVQVKDSSTPMKLTSQATVNVYEPLAITPATAAVDAGSSQPFTVNGGVPFTGPSYSFSLTGAGSIDPTSGTGTTYSAPSSTGIAVIQVTDSIGNIDQATVTVRDPATWGTRQTIDGPKWPGQYASLALDSSGYAQIAYWEAKDKKLKLAKQTGPTTWNLSTIDTNNGGDQYASLALYSGNACVAWYDAHSHRLKYALWYNNSWLTWDVDWDGDVGKYASLALDGSTGYPRIAYYDATNKDLKYAAWSGSDWDVTTVESLGDAGQYASLALNGSGNPRIAYYDAANGLMYVEYNGGWGTPQQVDGGNVGQYASLKLTSSGHPCIAYYDTTNADLKYAEWTGSDWARTTVDSMGDVGKFASLALNPSGNPRIAFYDASTTGGNLKYASSTGSVWVVGTVDNSTNNTGQYASIALDPASPYLMRIAYWDANAKDLLYIQEVP